MCGVSPLGSSPWRTREAGQSSRTGCLPPPLSYTSHSDWDPCRISEIISDTSVSPSLISVGIKCRKKSNPRAIRRDLKATDAVAVTPRLPACLPPCLRLLWAGKCHLPVFITSREPMAAGGMRLVPPASLHTAACCRACPPWWRPRLDCTQTFISDEIINTVIHRGDSKTHELK